MAPAFRGLLESDEHYYQHAGRSLLAVVEDDDKSAEAYVAIGFVWIAFVLSFLSLFFFGYQVSIPLPFISGPLRISFLSAHTSPPPMNSTALLDRRLFAAIHV
jgi:hypothetical protein